MKIFVGCSGFYYPEWKDNFYPPKLAKSKWLEYYAEQFNTIEVNSTFYRFPKISLFEGWYRRTPADFKFSVKVPQSITHYRRFNDVYDLLTQFYDLCLTGLKEKLGCILFQLPPSYSFAKEKLQLITDALSSDFKNVIEFRHISWWDPIAHAELNNSAVNVCSTSHPKLPADLIPNKGFFYLRMHGIPTIYQSAYKQTELNSLADNILQHNAAEVYAYFNNTMNLEAIQNAKYLRQLLS